MNKSRFESAVQELPPRGARSKSDISALRPLDHVVRGSEKTPPVPSPETPLAAPVTTAAEPLVDTSLVEEASIDDILFDEVVDEAPYFADGPEQPDFSSAGLDPSAYDAPGFYERSLGLREDAETSLMETRESDFGAREARAFAAFSEAAVDGLLDELRASLSSALAEAERVLGEPDRVATWFETQARKRLLSLSARFADELRATEVKRVLTSPPSKAPL